MICHPGDLSPGGTSAGSDGRQARMLTTVRHAGTADIFSSRNDQGPDSAGRRPAGQTVRSFRDHRDEGVIIALAG